MPKSLLVFLGSGLGGVFRYLLGGWIANAVGSVFPFGTLTVNVLGSFLIALVMQLALRGVVGPDTRLFLTTGVMGGFTTYSTFNYEALGLFQRSALGLGLAYLAATVLGCLLAGVLGLWLGRAVAGA